MFLVNILAYPRAKSYPTRRILMSLSLDCDISQTVEDTGVLDEHCGGLEIKALSH